MLNEAKNYAGPKWQDSFPLSLGITAQPRDPGWDKGGELYTLYNLQLEAEGPVKANNMSVFTGSDAANQMSQDSDEIFDITKMRPEDAGLRPITKEMLDSIKPN